MFDITDNAMLPEIDSGIELLLVQFISDALILPSYSTLSCAFAPVSVGTGNLLRGLSPFFLQVSFKCHARKWYMLQQSSA